MKLAQFKTKTSDQQRLGILIGDVVCDVSELARATKSTGRGVADWSVNVDSTLEVIERGLDGQCGSGGSLPRFD